MAGDEYSVGGGKLKLKGSKVSGGRVEKKKKKSSKRKDKEEKAQSPENAETGLEKSEEKEVARSEDERDRDTSGKTEAEKKYEEIRRKRVCITVRVGYMRD